MKILELGLNDIEPDLDQPRKTFSKEAQEDLEASIARWGLLQPIRIRTADDGAVVIVDGERRWRALCTLSNKHPEDTRFRTIRAINDDVDTSDEKSRKAVQLLSNETAPLMPTEKASVIRVLRSRGRQVLADEAIQREFGIAKCQLRYLSALADAPEFIQALGLPKVYEVPKMKNGEVVKTEDGKVERELVEKPPVPLSLLIEILALYTKFRRFDDAKFRETNGAHIRVAEKVIEKFGASAPREEWTRAELKRRARAMLRAYVEAKREIRRRRELKDLLTKWEREVNRFDPSEVTKDEWREACQSLRRLMGTLQERVESFREAHRDHGPRIAGEAQNDRKGGSEG